MSRRSSRVRMTNTQSNTPKYSGSWGLQGLENCARRNKVLCQYVKRRTDTYVALPPPSAPTNLSVDTNVVPNGTSMTLNWTAPFNPFPPITNYNYSTDDGANWISITPASAATTYTITGLTVEIEYTIKVRAVNIVGEGVSSSSVKAVAWGTAINGAPLDDTNFLKAIDWWIKGDDYKLGVADVFGTIGAWVVTGVTDMTSAFGNGRAHSGGVSGVPLPGNLDSTTFNDPINWTTTENVTDMKHMFDGAAAFNQPLNNWDVDKVNLMEYMFKDAIKFNQDLSAWVGMTSGSSNGGIQTTSHMFNGATDFNSPLPDICFFQTTGIGICSAQSMFQNAVSFNQPINNWDVRGQTTNPAIFVGTALSDMFNGAIKFNQPLTPTGNNWNVQHTLIFTGMFDDAHDFDQDLSMWDVQTTVTNITTFNGMFKDAFQNTQTNGVWTSGGEGFVNGIDAWINGPTTATEAIQFFSNEDNYAIGATGMYPRINGIEWIQLGSNITGASTTQQLSMGGVSLSSDYSTVAVLSKENSPGMAQVYKNLGGTWTLNGSFNNTDVEFSHQQIYLSSNGNVVAFGFPSADGTNGKVEVYKHDGGSPGTWGVMGGTITSFGPNGRLGDCVSLSDNGNIIACGAPYLNGVEGQVRMYEHDGGSPGNWVQKGSNLNGGSSGGEGWKFGSSVSLSFDGLSLAIGLPRKGHAGGVGTIVQPGAVRIYEWNGATTTWDQKGLEIVGEPFTSASGFEGGERLGSSVSLANAGTVVACGGPFNCDSFNLAGQVRVYEYIQAAWVQKGDDFNGDAAFAQAGTSVSLSDDGNTLAFGAPSSTGTGKVKVYKWDANTILWEAKGVTIVGESSNDGCGSSVSLTSDGNGLAIASPTAPAGGNDAGAARIFRWL